GFLSEPTLVLASDIARYRQFVPLLAPYRRTLLGALAAAASGPLLVAVRIWLLKVLIDTVIRGRHVAALPWVAAAFVAIAVVRGTVSFWDEKATARVGASVVADIRVRVFSRLQGMSLSYFHSQSLGDLLTRLSGDVGAIGDLLVTGLSTLVTYLTTIVVFVLLLLILDPALMLVALAILPALCLTTFVEGRMGRRAAQEQREAASHLTAVAEENLSAVALVKAFARRRHAVDRFALAARRSARARVDAVHVLAIFGPLTDVVVALGIAVVVYVGARSVLARTLSLGSLVVFITYLASLYSPVQGLARLIASVQRAMVGAGRVAELLDAPASLAERREPRSLPPPTGPAGLELRHVDFAYVAGRPVLCDVSLSVGSGEVVALVGPSGAGKTTVVSLALCYYDPTRGQVLIGGLPLDRFDPESARTQVAAVLQEPMLFDTTVAENIRYGRLEATEAEVRAAAQAACAGAFVEELPEGYDTVVGPRGARLSGGQRQRLAIARAVVKQAPIMVLDEATSALDPATEATVLSSLRQVCGHSAILLVAHRRSTVALADRVVMLDGGQVVNSRQGVARSCTAGRGWPG
ncbi:MAG: ABC transporter ATP-binding protein, partial [Acidimicrobiales bacterium]